MIEIRSRFEQATLSENPLAAFRQFRTNPLQFLLGTATLGDLVRIPSVTGRPSFIVHHPDLIRALFSSPAVHKGTSNDILGITLGTGLLTSEGELHTEQKRRMQPAFHASAIAHAFDDVARLTEARIAKWPSDTQLSFSSEMLNLTLDIVFQTMLGQTVGVTRETLHEVVEQSVAFSARRLMSPLPLPYGIPLPSHRRQRKAVSAFDDVIAGVIKNGRTASAGTLLKLLLDSKQTDGQPLPYREIRDEVATLVIAGHETTANLLTWAMYLLASHPDVLARVQEELDNHLANGSISFSDTLTLPFTRAVMKETLRLFPPAWTMLREARERIVIGNVIFPKGSTMIVSPYVIHRNPKFFTHPHAFHPERFLQEAERTWPKFAYIPFGGGNRTCIGNQFAQMETVSILGIILQRFTPLLIDGTVAQPEPSVSLRIRGGLNLRLRLR